MPQWEKVDNPSKARYPMPLEKCPDCGKKVPSWLKWSHKKECPKRNQHLIKPENLITIPAPQ